jgi:polyhydroxyalkanoate synthase
LGFARDDETAENGMNVRKTGNSARPPRRRTKPRSETVEKNSPAEKAGAADMNSLEAVPAKRKPRKRAARKVAAEPASAPLAEKVKKAPRPSLPAKAAEAEFNGPDFERIAYNMARLMEQGGKALAACLRPPETGETSPPAAATEISDALRSLSKVAEHWWSDPAKSLEAQSSLATEFIGLWAHTLRRMTGEREAPIVPYDPSDKRFAAPEWRENPYFDFLRQAHAIGSHWMAGLIDRSYSLDPEVRYKAKFYLRQISSALSPSNFLATNPEVLKETFASNGENLVRGAAFLAEDLEAGKGQLKIRRVDDSKFEIGVNLATSPGKVIFRNDLIELIQYAPSTDEVYRRPLLIIPPWINKFYILDLNPEKSFVRYAVSQGLTVFMISWVNPDERHRDKDFEDYMREGILAALDAIEQATGERKVTAIGYCIGGTLLSMTLAYLAQIKDERIDSASFFTTQTDFSQAGDLKVFVDEDRLRALEEQMAATGYLDASAMANAFNMLRPEDLIWSYFVNNYLKGQAPLAFDLLAWNSDSTRMPARNHLTYLRHCYLENRLAKGHASFGGIPLDLSKVTLPIYHLATREDHIAPARSVFIGAQYFGGDVRFVLAGSGHIAGVINSVAKPKYPYWLGKPPSGTFDDWFAAAIEHKGSWWTDWIAWVTRQSPEKVAARLPGDGKLEPICDAPGEFVRVRY